MKLIVVPSYYEGLARIGLEAMACGTIVLATPVGGFPGIIEEGKTGFFLDSVSPKIIARDITRVLENPALPAISAKVYDWVRVVKPYDSVSRGWSKMLEGLL